MLSHSGSGTGETLMVQYQGMPKATAAEKEHLARVKQLPCCVCLPEEQATPTEVHHILYAGKRIGHFHVLPLCEYHHRTVHDLRHQERLYWELLMESLGITDQTWPETKVVNRRII